MICILKFKVGDEDPLPGLEGVAQPLTQVDNSKMEKTVTISVLTSG